MFSSQHRVPLVKARWMNHNLTLKGHVESFTSGQGHNLIGKGHVAYQSIRIVGLNTPIYMVIWCFYRSSLSLSKVIAEKLLVTFHDLKWSRWHEGRGSLVAIFRFRVSSLPVTRCVSVSNGFRPKEAPFNFPYLLIMERSQNWPGRGSPISTFRDIYFIDRYCYGYQSP